MNEAGIALDALFADGETACFLAGSGISSDAPTSLPTGYQFTEALLRRILPEEVVGEIPTLMNPEREGVRGPGDFLRFEGLLLHLQESFDPALQVLDGFDAVRTPNSSHFALATLVRHGAPVLTSNFDCLIERALVDIGVPRHRLFPVIHEQDWDTVPEEDEYPVYKLHGSFFDVRWEMHCRESLQATLWQVAGCKGELFLLEPWKRRVLEPMLRRHDLVVLGYSGLDDFDILPTLWSIESRRRVVWVEHDSSRTVGQARIERIQNGQLEADRVARNLLGFVRSETREPSRVVRVRVHTAQFLDWLIARYPESRAPVEERPPADESEFLFPAHLELSPFDRWELAGDLFEECGRVEQALDAYAAALVHMLTVPEWQRAGHMASILNSMGRMFRRQGDLDAALENFRQALALAERADNLGTQSVALNNIAIVQSGRGETEEALGTHRRALAIAESQDNKQGRSTILSNIGGELRELGRLDEALSHFHEALRLATELGNLRGLTATMNGIAATVSGKGRPDEALRYYRKALRVARLLGDAQEEETISANIAMVLRHGGRAG